MLKSNKKKVNLVLSGNANCCCQSPFLKNDLLVQVNESPTNNQIQQRTSLQSIIYLYQPFALMRQSTHNGTGFFVTEKYSYKKRNDLNALQFILFHL